MRKQRRRHRDGTDRGIGALAPGARLAPQRDVASSLGVSVQTVSNAYKELERQGLIRCEVVCGSFVAARVTESMSNDMLDTAEREMVDFSIAREEADEIVGIVKDAVDEVAERNISTVA